MTRKLHSAKNGNTFHPIAGPHCIVVCSIHLRFLYVRLHSFLTILGFYVGCMGPRTTKSAIIPFYEFGYWDLVFNSFMKWSKPLWKSAQRAVSNCRSPASFVQSFCNFQSATHHLCICPCVSPVSMSFPIGVSGI